MIASEITADRICLAFKRTGIKPINGGWCDPEAGCGCASTALILDTVKGMTIDKLDNQIKTAFSPYEIAGNMLGITSAECQALACGWDGSRKFYWGDKTEFHLWVAGYQAALQMHGRAPDAVV